MEHPTAVERLTTPWEHLSNENALIGFVDSLLRGCGQVMFQNNPLTGLLILIGIFVNSTLLGLTGVIGLVVSTLTAVLLKADRSAIRAGLFGYNGILTGIGLAVFLKWSPTLPVYIVVASILSSLVMMSLVNMLGSHNIPALTAPFVLTTWLFLLAAFLLSRLVPAQTMLPALLKPGAVVQTDLRPLPASLMGAGATPLNFVEAFFRGIGNVFFQDNLLTGVIFLVAILINSRISGLFAALGSLVGLLSAHFLLGGDGNWVYHGLYGFNAVLCAIAIGGIFYVLTWQSALYALFCALIATITMASISVLLSPLGLPALTAPFVLSAWLFILPRTGFLALRPVTLEDITNPERIRRAYREQALAH